MTAAAVGRSTGQTTVMLLRNTEQLLDLGYEENVWVIDLIRVEFLHFCFCNEATLVPKSLLGQVLPTIVSYFLLGTSKVLFPQILAYLEQHQSILGSLHGKRALTSFTNFVRFVTFRSRCDVHMLITVHDKFVIFRVCGLTTLHDSISFRQSLLRLLYF